MTWVIVLGVVVIMLLFVHYQTQSCITEIQSSRSTYLSAISAHDQSYLKVIDSLRQDSERRESNLRSEIQALTEALGRSKEYVQVVYPHDMSKPLEPSEGWFDAKPELRSHK